MNNKGFAITTILYGTLILFLMLLLSMLGILNAYKDRLSMLIDSNNGARAIINGTVGKTWLCGDVDGDGVLTTDDATHFENYLAGDESSSLPVGVSRDDLDFNGDGEVDVHDSDWLYNHVMYEKELYPLNCP